MNAWKQLLLGAYYYGTMPYRRYRGARQAARGAAPVMILFYHRVADSCPNDWTLSRRRFAQQLRWLRANFDLVTLGEAQRQIASGRNDRPRVSITFDDGYAENCRWVLPLLVGEQIPFTYFVATRHVAEGLPFEHDVAAGQPLPVNTVDDVRRLAAAGVEIGSHTRTHADLGSIADRDWLRGEIALSRQELEEMIGRPVRYLAFPFGQRENMSRKAVEMAREAGYAGVCSAYGGYNWPGDDPFHLRRIHADRELIRLKNWLDVDPRKLRAGDCDADFTPSAVDLPTEPITCGSEP